MNLTASFVSRGLLVAIAMVAAPATAQWSSAAVVTEDGVELSVDARVFALFAVLNALGYDDDTVTGPPPLSQPQYAAARSKLRSSLGRIEVKDLKALVDKNPAPVRDYVAAVLELSTNLDAPATASPLCKSLAGPLKEWFLDEGGNSLLRAAGEEARPTQKRLLPELDKAIHAVTKLVRLGDKEDQLLDDSGAERRVAVVLNELDSHGSLQVVNTTAQVFVVAGPLRNADDDKRVIDAAVLHYARTVVARETKKVAAAGTLLDGFSKLTVAKYSDVANYAEDLLACAVARQVRPTTGCGPLDEDAEGKAALTALLPRVAQYAPTTALFSVALPELLAPAPAAAAAPVDDGKKKKDGKKGKG
jgi:hypothetical protein